MYHYFHVQGIRIIIGVDNGVVLVIKSRMTTSISGEAQTLCMDIRKKGTIEQFHKKNFKLKKTLNLVRFLT